MQAKKHIQCLKFYAAQFIQEGKNIWSHIYLRKFIISGELSKQVIIESQLQCIAAGQQYTVVGFTHQETICSLKSIELREARMAGSQQYMALKLNVEKQKLAQKHAAPCPARHPYC